VADDLKIKGPVREIGIARDADRHDSFNITIGIAIKTEGRVSYEEAERLSARFRREYLGKDVEFRAIHIPCPHCDKVLNSESGLKQHILKIHPEKAELITPPKVAAKEEKPEKKARGQKVEKPAKAKKTRKRRKAPKAKTVKAVGAGKTARIEKPKAAGKAAPRPEAPPTEGPKTKTAPPQPPTEPRKMAPDKQTKARQLTLG
jgi:hypothetical protein